MGRLMLWLGAAALALGATGVAAQDKPAAADSAGLESFMDAIPRPEPLTPEQAERLPLAMALAEKVLPPGSLRSATGGTFGSILAMSTANGEPSARDVVTRRLGGYLDDTGLTDADLERMATMLDPQWQERERRMRAFSQQAMGRVFDAMEPVLRQAFAELYAINFTAAELAEIDAFFSTPTGAAYASRSYLMASDPRMVQSTVTMMPEVMTQMALMESEAAAATADLPPQRNYADLSANERKQLARDLGIAVEELEYTLLDAVVTAP